MALLLAWGSAGPAAAKTLAEARAEPRGKAPPVSEKTQAEGLSQPTLKLFKAVELNDMAAVKTSIEAGADLLAENEEGMTAADLAVDRGHFIVAHYLLSRRLLGETPPVALVPGKRKKAAEAVRTAAKRKFASPPPKPRDRPVSPAPSGRPSGPPGEKGNGQFFKSLVEQVRPGGETPPEEPETTKQAPPDETIVEAAVEESDKVVIEETGDAPPAVSPERGGPTEIVEELTEDAPAKLEETTPETMTADMVVEIDPEQEAKEPEAKPEEKKQGFLERMAGLFSSDQNQPDEGKEDPGEAKPPATPTQEIAAYELPLPPPKPQATKKFSPRFLDKLADFLEKGDEEEFKAWLPEMQIMNAASRPDRKPLEIPAETAAKPEGTEAPAPEKAPMTPVKEVALTEAPAAEPDSAKPVAAETPPEKPGFFKGAFDKLVGVLTPDLGNKDRSGRVALEPEEKLAAAVGTTGEKEAKEGPPKYWPITKVETAEKPALAMRRPMKVPLPENVLKGVTLSLGESVSLENSFPPIGRGIDPHNRCVKKNRGTTLFCLEAVDWPEKMQADFLVPTILYTGQKAIARYDQGIASRFHALFPSEAFARVAAFFHERFGDPTDVWNRSIAPFAQPRQDNPTLAWRSFDPKTQVVTILEIRKYDDSRGGFPDTKRGAVMLYLANSPPIFPQVSSHELMRISRSRMAPPGTEPMAPPEGAEEGMPPETKSSEELQVERRKRKAAEAAKKAGGEEGEPGAKPPEDDLELPPDPQGR